MHKQIATAVLGSMLLVGGVTTAHAALVEYASANNLQGTFLYSNFSDVNGQFNLNLGSLTGTASYSMPGAKGNYNLYAEGSITLHPGGNQNLAVTTTFNNNLLYSGLIDPAGYTPSDSFDFNGTGVNPAKSGNFLVPYAFTSSAFDPATLFTFTPSSLNQGVYPLPMGGSSNLSLSYNASGHNLGFTISETSLYGLTFEQNLRDFDAAANNNGLISGTFSMDVTVSSTPVGGSQNEPIMPVGVQPGEFTFNAQGSPSDTTWFDPLLATGYDYQVTSGGSNFTSVTLPDIGDGLYELFLYQGGSWVDQGPISANSKYPFAGSGVDRFRILGIELSAGLDPNNPLAFPTGLTFAGPNANFDMTALTTSVPEPATLSLWGLGLAGLSLVRRKAKAA